LAALVDRLTTRLGDGHVYRLTEAESHIPERAVRRINATDRPPEIRKVKRVARPIRLFHRPEPIEAIAPYPDDPPAQIRWRRVPRRIVKADGPERIEPEWWKPRDASAKERDYYRLEDENGRRYWVFRSGPMNAENPAQWFVHGVFH
jgi:protein ImuB